MGAEKGMCFVVLCVNKFWICSLTIGIHNLLNHKWNAVICIQAQQAAKVHMTEVSDTELLLAYGVLYAAAIYVGVSLPGWMCSLTAKQGQETKNSMEEKVETIQTIADFVENIIQNLASHHADDGGSGDDGGGSGDDDGD